MSFICKSSFINKKHFLIIFWGIFISACLFRLLIIHLTPVLETDSVLYVHLIEDFYHGKPMAYSLHSSFYVYLAGRFMFLGLSPVNAAYLLSFLASCLLLLLSYGIAKIIFNNRLYALLTMILVAFHPTLIDLGARIIRDGLYLFIFALIIYLLLLSYKKGKLKYYFLAGVLCPIGLYTRKEGLELFFMLAITFAALIYVSEMNLRQKLLYAGKLLLLSSFAISIGFAFMVWSLGDYNMRVLHKTYETAESYYTAARGK